MCVLRIEEFEKNYRLELIDRELEQQCVATFEALDVARRSKFIFQLTVWKSRKVELNLLEFRRGFSYRFEKIHSLPLLYGNTVGSMQIPVRVRANLLPDPGVGVRTSGSYSLLSGADEPEYISGSNATPATLLQEERESTVSELQPSKNKHRSS
ncbi:hypothetical protein PF010_g23660 [Phytophthora fragariae]|nr:hypothetical protein PF003_g1311 [Phytophthora fragariae]KAE8924738.1 hypothetical protein PF009_g25036 [Phytophthora fragariae]KAE9073426.1 hypothetical protein PF007_g25808 [Phytophthora fragariae]KAE9077050.1 hypothetical protein PF010_g23660 [Phytophthora fragariae]KAE9146255.1 hypothetical protein PF006_g8964 [Phytophthora fragariae]